ncbi:MAG: lycopene cyclase domain-containing protein [Thermoanaerobaculia bacterium]
MIPARFEYAFILIIFALTGLTITWEGVVRAVKRRPAQQAIGLFYIYCLTIEFVALTRGWWTFDARQALGVYIWRIPVEELLFSRRLVLWFSELGRRWSVSATAFLCVQLAASAVAVWAARRLLRKRLLAVRRLLLFVVAASYSFDYVANDQLIWQFRGDWGISLLLNPLENSLFAAMMALHLLPIHLALASRGATRGRRSRTQASP